LRSAKFPHKSKSQVCRLVGLLLMVLGFVHIPIYLLGNHDWEGLTSWRKPILFGLSTGVTLLSLAWVLDHLARDREEYTRFDYILGVAALIEVSLITIETWLDIPAHFNLSAGWPFWGSVVIEGCLLVLLTTITKLTLMSSSRLGRTEPKLVAIRRGMLLLWLGCVLGGLHVIYGYYRVSQGQNPHLVPPQGIPKFAHGMPLHGIQILPLIWLLSDRLGYHTKIQIVLLAKTYYLILVTTAYAALQVLNGASRFSPSWLSLPLLVALGILFADLAICLFRPLIARMREGGSPDD
jgi:hypothetical protein